MLALSRSLFISFLEVMAELMMYMMQMTANSVMATTIAVRPVSLMKMFSKSGGKPIVTISVSKRIANTTKMPIIENFSHDSRLLPTFAFLLMKRMFRHISRIRAKELEKTFREAVIRSPGVYNPLENKDNIPSLKKKTMIIAQMIQVR